MVGTLFPAVLPVWEACRTRGVDVRVIGTTWSPYSGVFPWRPTNAHEVVAADLRPAVSTRRGHLWWWYRGLGNVLGRLKPDLVHVAIEPWGLPVIQVLAQRRHRGAPRVVAHGAETLPEQGGTLERWVRLQVLRQTLTWLDGYVGWSALAVSAMRRAGLPVETPTAVVPAVLPDPNVFRPPSDDEIAAARARFGLPPAGHATVVGFIGRLVPEKGVDDLVAVARRLGGSRIAFAVWGAGPLRASLAARLGRAGAILGPLDHREVATALHACDLVMMPSRRTASCEEQFGRVAVEAMMCGRPVVAYSTGALPDVVGEGGVLVPEGDVEGLARAVGHLAESPERRAALGTCALHRARSRFSPTAAATRLIAFWEEVLRR